MQILDKLFQIVFARYRRKLGDAHLQSAWLQASNRVQAYLAWPIIVAELIFTMLIYSTVIKGTALDSTQALVTPAAVVAIAIAYYLSRGFRKYSSDPLPLLPTESRAETLFVSRFRATSIGAFVLTCLVGFLLHRAGVPVVPGLK